MSATDDDKRDEVSNSGERASAGRVRPRASWLVAGCALALTAPGLLAIVCWSRIELREAWRALPVDDTRIVLALVACGLVASAYVARTYLVLLTAEVTGASAVEIRQRLVRLLRTLPMLVVGVLAIAASGVAALSLLGAAGAHAPFTTVDYVAAFVLLLMLGSLMLVPLYLVCLREFGLAFGRLLDDAPLVTGFWRSAPAPALVLAMGLAVLLGDFLSPAGLGDAASVFGFTFLPFVLAVAWIGARYNAEAVPAEAAGGNVRHAVAAPRSLDGFGLVEAREKRLRERLADSEARLQTFADAASDFYFETDEMLHLSWFSDRMEKLTGIDADSLVGRPMAAVAAELGYALDAGQLDLLWDNEPFRDVIVECPAPKGQPRKLRLSAVPEFDRGGLFVGYRGVGTDITAIAAAEERLRERDAQLAQAQKMEAVGQLTGGVAHDFNNLLLVVSGNLELALEHSQDPELRRLVETAIEATGRGASLIRQLLAFSRRQMLHPKAIDLEARLDGLRSLLLASLGERIELELDFDQNLRKPLVDAAQFESALLNLTINARDAMPRGGRLRISARDRNITDAREELRPGHYVEVIVEDTGEGMTEDVLARVFEPFFSTKGVGRGSGLGLSMVYGFARQSSGAIAIDSVRGVGTRVSLFLPSADADSLATSGVAAGNAAAPAAGGERVLMVEDEPHVREALAESLRAAGYAVIPAARADDALRMVDGGLQFDLLLSDIVLPGDHSGVDLVEVMRRRRSDLPCLLMSGYSEDHLRDAGDALRDVEVMEKPFAREMMLERIAALLAARGAPDSDGLRDEIH